MSARVLLDADDPSLKTYIDGDDDGNLYLKHTQDLTDLVADNKRIKSIIGKDITRDHDKPRYVARLSNLVLMDLVHRGIITVDGAPGREMTGKVIDEKRWRRWLNDPENRHFRTSEGKV